MIRRSSGLVICESQVVNLGARGVMATGICFLDHMIDQLTSHAQLGVTVRVALDTPEGADPTWLSPHEDYARNSLADQDRLHDADIFKAAGAALGAALRRVVQDVQDEPQKGEEEPQAKRQRVEGEGGDASTDGSAPVVFCCPLDEAFCESTLILNPGTNQDPGTCETLLAPYGSMPPAGRTWIGCYRCALTPSFWSALTLELGANLRLRKVRGINAHHVVESTFKAFARSFRAALDGTRHGGAHGLVGAAEDRVAVRGRTCGSTHMAPPSAAIFQSPRTACKSRSTKETSIDVKVDLDHPSLTLGSTLATEGGLKTGVFALSHLLSRLQELCGFAFDVQCSGDTYIDDHHSSEDLGITLGQCLLESLGSKAGLTRMGCAEAEHGVAKVRVVMDLSNRPSFECDLNLDEEYLGGPQAVADVARAHGKHAPCGVYLTCEMFLHLMESVTVETRSTVHVVTVHDDAATAGHTMDLAIATVEAYAKALAECLRLDPRRAGKVASSKGTLSL